MHYCTKPRLEANMEPVRMGIDFKLPRIGRRPIQSTAGAVAVRGEKGEEKSYLFKVFLSYLCSECSSFMT